MYSTNTHRRSSLFRRKSRKGVQKKTSSPAPAPLVDKATMASLQNSEKPANLSLTWVAAIVYIISGATQPLLVTLIKISGLGDHMCQLYMLMYYLGPAMVSFTLCGSTANNSNDKFWSYSALKAAGITLLDVAAQTINYTGSTWSGPTIFAIIYSSVTIWTAVYSRLLLGRKLRYVQWLAIFIVFGGLAITATDSVAVGPDVFKGSLMVLIGSSFHAMTYVMSEAIMTDKDQISPQLNCSIQGLVASSLYLSWQFVYTSKHLEERVISPMEAAGTSITKAIIVLVSLALSNLVHALSFFYTLKHYPGGATSAGVMKGLQAVLVFIFTSLVYSGSYGGQEMCFSLIKLLSLFIVLGGVTLFTAFNDDVSGNKSDSKNDGYVQVGNIEEGGAHVV
jgi:drug/metabolite transporter (DMT)-like permease